MKKTELLILLCLFCLQLVLPANVLAQSYIDDNNQAIEMAESGDYFAAVELMKQAISRSAGNETIKNNLSNIYLTGAEKFLHKERFEELAALMLDAQEFDDTEAFYWYMRGVSLLRQKDYFEAETELLEARSMRNDDERVLFMLGQLYYQTDRMYEAFDVLETANMLASEHHGIKQMLEKVRRELAVEREMEKEYGGHFVITFDGEQDEDLGEEVLEVLEEAYNWVGRQLDHYPEERVTVLLYSRQQFSDLTDSPEWAGGLYDGKIRLPVGGVSRVNDQIRALLYHEYMHVVLRDIAGGNLPYWLNEGLAEVAEAEFEQTEPDVLKMAIDQEKLFSLKTLEGSFSNFNGMQVLLAYQQSHSVVKYLIDQYGWHMVRDLVFALAAGDSIEAAVEVAFGIYGLDYQRLESGWRGQI